MSIFRDFFVKEKPIFTGITRGVGGFGFGAAGGAGGLTATISPGPDAGVPGGTFTFDPGQVLKLQKAGGNDFTISFDQPASIQVFVWGGAGGKGQGDNPGGGGSKVTATIDVVSGQDYLFTVGEGGSYISEANPDQPGFNGGGAVGPSGYSVGRGGGYSGVFLGTSKTQPAAIVIAGGGGGGGYRVPTGAGGGSGGHPSGQDGANNPGSGGTQSAGGSGGGDSGYALNGGKGAAATAAGGGGGGGYFGGSGGAGSNSNNGTGAGGGSSYQNPTYVPTFAATTPNGAPTSPEPTAYWPGSAGRGGFHTPGTDAGEPGAIAIYIN